MSFSSVFYENLIKPPLQPPDWIFTPVWSILYALLFIAFVIVITANSKYKMLAIIFFLVQLVLNIAWPFVFFGQNEILYALYILMALVVFAFICMMLFFSVSKTAGMLLVPYILWLLFALHLNYQIVSLNLR